MTGLTYEDVVQAVRDVIADDSTHKYSVEIMDPLDYLGTAAHVAQRFEADLRGGVRQVLGQPGASRLPWKERVEDTAHRLRGSVGGSRFATRLIDRLAYLSYWEPVIREEVECAQERIKTLALGEEMDS